MTPADETKGLRALLEGTTLPWSVYYCAAGYGIRQDPARSAGFFIAREAETGTGVHARLIVAAVNALPRLLDRIERTERERDALRKELAAVRRAVQTHDNARRIMNAYEVARLDALPPKARQAAIDDASRAWLQALEEARHWNEVATNATERAEHAETAAKVLAEAVDFARAAAVHFAAAAIAERKRKAQPREDSLRLKALLLELLKALRPPGLRPDLPEWEGSVWALLYVVRQHTEKALKDRDTLRTLLRSILRAWEEAPSSRRHEVTTLLPSLAQALQTAREGRNAEWWTRE